MINSKPSLYTTLSPTQLHLHEVRNSVVVIIDVLRATSTIVTALFNGARYIIPVEDVPKCIEWGKQIECITAGERDGRIADGLQYGNSPFEYPRDFVEGKVLVLTTTNGTRLLHMALRKGATTVITGSFANLTAVCEYLKGVDKNVILGCAGWKDRINMEDTLFAGALISRIKDHFTIDCDSSKIAEILYEKGKGDLFQFMKINKATHFERLSGYGLEKDIEYCLTSDTANILPFYDDGKIVVKQSRVLAG